MIIIKTASVKKALLLFEEDINRIEKYNLYKKYFSVIMKHENILSTNVKDILNTRSQIDSPIQIITFDLSENHKIIDKKTVDNYDTFIKYLTNLLLSHGGKMDNLFIDVSNEFSDNNESFTNNNLNLKENNQIEENNSLETEAKNMIIIRTASVEKEAKKKEKWKYNPWAVCHSKIDSKEEPEKYERCVMDVKKKQKKAQVDIQQKIDDSPALSPKVKRRINDSLYSLTLNYQPEIPLKAIFHILHENGIKPLQEDGSDWSGLLMGQKECGTPEASNQKAHIELARISNGVVLNSYLVLTWCTMPSGKYEVLAYLS